VDLDKERLAKLLNMTGSDHDAEALAAVRKANEILRLHRKSWRDVLGVSAPPPEPQRAPEPPRTGARPRTGAPRPTMRPRPPEPPPGHQRLRYYRDALRHEPLLPRLLGFPFWLLVELAALAVPNSIINARGQFIAIVFAFGMILGIAGWIWLGYYLLFVL
jgi:hypothetical protein